jgi:hypothetical protein
MLRRTASDETNRVTEMTSIVIVNTANSVLTFVGLCFYLFLCFCYVMKNYCHSE